MARIVQLGILWLGGLPAFQERLPTNSFADRLRVAA
jgi:hypothetical protein